MNKIDLVVPYVDNSDPNWIALFNKYVQNNKINTDIRYSSNPMFKYFFRAVEKCIPWINNIFLLVQSESQIPKFLNQKTVKIIYHDQFIFKEYLPTFNSSAIEMFLWNIPNLSENFLYLNDDIFFVNPINGTYFFKDNNPINYLIEKPNTLSITKPIEVGKSFHGDQYKIIVFNGNYFAQFNNNNNFKLKTFYDCRTFS